MRCEDAEGPRHPPGTRSHHVLANLPAAHAAGITPNPDTSFMAQGARNLTAHDDGFLRGTRYLILDRDSKFPASFVRIIQDAGITVIRTAYQAPNMNSIAERWVLSVKSECLDRMIQFGEGSLRRTLREYGAHFHHERPHQGIGNNLIDPLDATGPTSGEVIVDERLGGLLCSYRRIAA